MKKTVLITGASKGIGRETSLAFANAGYNVGINYFTSAKSAEEVYDQCPDKDSVMLVKADVSSEYDVNTMAAQVTERFGRIDVLVNNAGISNWGLISDITSDQWDRVFAVNVKGMYNCVKAILPSMIRAQKGSIINVSSVWGVQGASCEVCYSASKAAIIGFTKALAKETGPSGINVNCVAPGVILTDMNKRFSEEIMEGLKDSTALCRLGTPKDVADTILFLASNAASYITGQIIGVDGGFL